MNIVIQSIGQPTRERFDLEAHRRWEGEGGMQTPAFAHGAPKSTSEWPLRMGISVFLRRVADLCLRPVDWIVSSDGRFARDTREMFGIPYADRSPGGRS